MSEPLDVEEPTRTREAVRQCAEWLSQCLSFGWRKEDLDFLELLWWKHHDHRGQLIVRPLPPDEPSIALSAIRALVQQWRERVAVCLRISTEVGATEDMALAQAWHEEADHKDECANELAALCAGET